MGSKNRIFLGRITNIMNHIFKNTFEKDVYMTDATAKKIEEKHPPLDKEYIYNHNFQIIIDNTIMIYPDNKKDKLIYNCLSKVDGRFFIYGMISKGKRTEISTLFIGKPNQIKKRFFENENTRRIKKELFQLN